MRDNGKAVGYQCRGAPDGNAGACLSFGAVRADTAVSAAVREALQPLGVEAALQAWDERGEAAEAAERLGQQALGGSALPGAAGVVAV